MASSTGWNDSTNSGAVGNDQSSNNSSGFTSLYQTDLCNSHQEDAAWPANPMLSRTVSCDSGALKRNAMNEIFRSPANLPFAKRMVRRSSLVPTLPRQDKLQPSKTETIQEGGQDDEK